MEGAGDVVLLLAAGLGAGTVNGVAGGGTLAVSYTHLDVYKRQAAFCAATLLADGDNLGPAYFAIAAVVAVSRVHVQIHHASDVVGGAVIGVALGGIGRAISPLPTPSLKRRSGR